MQMILKILASAAGVFAAYFISRTLAGWIQSWNDSHQKKDATEARTKAQQDNQAANAAGDALKKIDGR